MKKANEGTKRLKLDIETVRRLENDELENVVGGQGQADAAAGITVSLSWRDCRCQC